MLYDIWDRKHFRFSILTSEVGGECVTYYNTQPLCLILVTCNILGQGSEIILKRCSCMSLTLVTQCIIFVADSFQDVFMYFVDVVNVLY